jgi:NAD-dependent deacetylase
MSLDGINIGNIVILTGAGISAESGIETFRDKGGVWERNRIDDVATPEAFNKDPKRVHEFYNARRRAIGAPEIQPNAAHKALALLEQRLPSRVLIVTQNIDDLHERAGSRNLIHMHGELMKARCAECGEVRPQIDDLDIDAHCLRCREMGVMRPHVVWFGEMPFELERISEALETCALFISIGTSGSVYPASGFVHEVRMAGRAHTVELSLEPSSGESHFAERHYGPASRIVPGYVDRILAGESEFDPS